MSHASVPAVTRLTTAELTWLLSLRPGASSGLVASALGLRTDAPVDPEVPARLLAAGRAREHGDDVLPHGGDAVVGDVLTAATTLVSIGTRDALAALVVVGRDRVLLLAPDGRAGVEVAAVAAEVTVGALVAEVAAGVEEAVVMVARPGGEIRTVTPGPGLAQRVQELLT